jgi:hypothetical protein
VFDLFLLPIPLFTTKTRILTTIETPVTGGGDGYAGCFDMLLLF